MLSSSCKTVLTGVVGDLRRAGKGLSISSGIESVSSSGAGAVGVVPGSTPGSGATGRSSVVPGSTPGSRATGATGSSEGSLSGTLNATCADVMARLTD